MRQPVLLAILASVLLVSVSCFILSPETPTPTAVLPTSTPTTAPHVPVTHTATPITATGAAAPDAEAGSGARGEGTPAARATSGGGQSAAAAGLDVPAIEAALADVTSFRAELSGSEGDQPVSGTMEVVLPDRYTLVVKSVPGSEALLETIGIGSDTYMKQGGTWEKLPLGESGIGFDPTTFDKLTDRLSDPTTTVSRRGTATVQGEKCQEWDAYVHAELQTLCVGDDNLVRRMQTGGMTVEIFDYNADIQIIPPTV